MSDPLNDLFVRHGSDKGIDHGYGPFYEKHFPQPPTALLEIGVASGSSLLAWKEWGVERVVGIDIRPPPGFDAAEVIGGDATDWRIAEQILGPFDVVVDDGSHNPGHVLDAYWLYRLKLHIPGGWYVVEDTVNMGTHVHDLFISEVQRQAISELHLYHNLIFARM